MLWIFWLVGILAYGASLATGGWPIEDHEQLRGPLLASAGLLLTVGLIFLLVFKKSDAIRLDYDADWPDEDGNSDENVSVDELDEELLASYEFWPSKSADGDALTFMAEINEQEDILKLDGEPIIFHHYEVSSLSPIGEVAIYSILFSLPVGALALLNEFLEFIDSTLLWRVAWAILFAVVIPASLFRARQRKVPLAALRRKVIKNYAKSDRSSLIDDIESILAADPGNAPLVALRVDILVRQGEYQRALDSLAALDDSDELRVELQSKIEKIQAWNGDRHFSHRRLSISDPKCIGVVNPRA